MAEDRVKAEHLVAVTWPEDTGAPLIQGNGWSVHATHMEAVLPLRQQEGKNDE